MTQDNAAEIAEHAESALSTRATGGGRRLPSHQHGMCVLYRCKRLGPSIADGPDSLVPHNWVAHNFVAEQEVQYCPAKPTSE
jgi:hypothetical protein